MEKELNIAKILADKPKGTKLYSPIFGECVPQYSSGNLVKDIHNFCVKTSQGLSEDFFNDGRYNECGECLLFPSKSMRDWSKFSWKKGDVLVSDHAKENVIFESFTDDTYIYFRGKHWLERVNENKVSYYQDSDTYCTSLFSIEAKDSAQHYIKLIEERLGSKLNMETLVVEEQDFKDGDVVTHTDGSIVLVKEVIDGKIYHHAVLRKGKDFEFPAGAIYFFGHRGDYKGFATEEEKQKLFDAIEKEGKKWNPETKQIEDIKPKCEFKTFDRVVVRDFKDEDWIVDIFSHKKENCYACVGGSWNVCLPYNEETAKLLGTTKSLEDLK